MVIFAFILAPTLALQLPSWLCGRRSYTPDLDASGVSHEAGVAIREAGAAKGLGAFALRSFEEGQVVGDYVGEHLTKLEFKRRVRFAGKTGNYVFQIDEDLLVDAENVAKANWTRYINHSGEDPNLRVKSLAYAYGGRPRVWFVATRHIREGEELCFDYGPDYWHEDDVVVA